MSLPIVDEVKSSVTGAYDSLKKSSNDVKTLLNATEEQINEAAKILSPVTETVGEVLEKPLKTVDNVICEGLDYVGDKLPQLKEQSTEIYENVEKYVR